MNAVPSQRRLPRSIGAGYCQRMTTALRNCFTARKSAPGAEYATYVRLHTTSRAGN